MLASDLLIFLAMFARISGFFLISPLFSNREIPIYVRFGLTLTCSLLLAPVMTTLPRIESLPILLMIKEVLIGYFLGFLFSLIFEAATMAGQVVGTMSGFSATELVDPNFASKPLFGKLFMLSVFLLFLASDFHHLLLRFLFESFTMVPIGPFSKTMLLGMAQAATHLFTMTLNFAIVPMVLLGIVITCFAILTRFLPDLPIFWIGFPLQMIIGFFALALALTFFNDIFKNGFIELMGLTKRLLFPL